MECVPRVVCGILSLHHAAGHSRLGAFTEEEETQGPFSLVEERLWRTAVFLLFAGFVCFFWQQILHSTSREYARDFALKLLFYICILDLWAGMRSKTKKR